MLTEDWGRIDYFEAWQKQKEYVELRIRDEIPDTIIFCEHDPVITIGRGAQRGPAPIIMNSSIPRYEIERGGLVTYHGPGQLVAYPIFKLGQGEGSSKTGVLSLIRALERWMLTYLKAEHGLDAQIIPEKTGVWINGERKIGSIGISARHWVSYHGLSLNFATGLEPWTWINPCGFEASVMTDLERETGKKLSYDEIRQGMLEMAPSAFSLSHSV